MEDELYKSETRIFNDLLKNFILVINKKEFFEILKNLISSSFYISTELFVAAEEYVNDKF